MISLEYSSRPLYILSYLQVNVHLKWVLLTPNCRLSFIVSSVISSFLLHCRRQDVWAVSALARVRMVLVLEYYHPILAGIGWYWVLYDTFFGCDTQYQYRSLSSKCPTPVADCCLSDDQTQTAVGGHCTTINISTCQQTAVAGRVGWGEAHL